LSASLPKLSPLRHKPSLPSESSWFSGFFESMTPRDERVKIAFSW